MAIFLTETSKVIVQGMTGSEGQKHTTRMLASGTAVVGGVNPRKAGTAVTFPGPGGEASLGDIVISLETAARNAPRFGRTFAQEVDILTLHGFLHVLGYDHEKDDGTMERLERRLRKRLLGHA